MNKFGTVPLLLIVLVCAGCGKIPSEGEQESGNVISYDMGATFLDSEDRSSWTACHDFSFQNPSSTATAELQIARKTCGCTHCTIQHPDLGPGDTATATLSFDLPYFRKSMREGVVITTGLSEIPEIELYLAAEAYPRLTTIPCNLPPINVRAGESARAEIAFVAYEPEGERTEKLEMTPVGAGVSVERVQPKSVETRAGVRKTVVECILLVSCPTPDDGHFGNGHFSGQLDVRHGRWRLKQDFSYQAEVVVQASPSQVFLQAGHHESEKAALHLTALEPFTILSIEAESSSLEYTYSKQNPGCNHDILVQLNRSKMTPQSAKSLLVIHVNHPNQRVVKVPVFILWQ